MNVAIYYNGLGLLRGLSLDVSRHGMFVTTGPMVLPLHAIVDVAFPLESGKHGEPPRRTSAMVVRLANEGMGLMFNGEVNTGPLGLSVRNPQDHAPALDTSSG